MVIDNQARPEERAKVPEEDFAMQEAALKRENVSSAESVSEEFVSLLETYERELFNFAYRLTGNRQDAEDLLQESFFKAYKYFFQLRDKSKFKEWIFQITANQFRNLLRKKKRERLTFPEDFEKNVTETLEQAPSRNPDETFSRRDNSNMVMQAMDEIGSKMRSVLVLFELEGLSIEEISDMLAVSRGTVKSRLHYARRKLKAVLTSEEFRERHDFKDMESGFGND